MRMLSIRISHDQVSRLYEACIWLAQAAEVDTPHEQLLQAHVVEFTGLFYARMVKQGTRCLIHLSQLQCLAWLQIWVGTPLPADLHQATEVQKVIDLIDKKKKINKQNKINTV